MRIDVVTLFPDMFEGPFGESIIKRAMDKKIVEIKIHNLRDWATDKRKTVDDKPYGGGPGMIMRVDIVDRALQALKQATSNKRQATILLTAKGEKYKQEKAKSLAKEEHLILVAGHYEGFDERVRDLVDEEISIGDYVLTGGELAAMVVVDSVVRLLPGVLGDSDSLKEESHSKPGVLEYPQYTRSEDYKGKKVPEILKSGDHKKIEEWKKSKLKKIS